MAKGKGQVVEAYRSNEYYVTIDNFDSPRFSRVSGLSDGEIDAIEIPDGGSVIVHKQSGAKVKFEDLTLERYVDGSSDDQAFLLWFRTVFNLDGSGVVGSAPEARARRAGSIVVTRFGVDVMRFTFSGAWIRSSKFSELQAGGNEVMKQTIVLSIDSMKREMLAAAPPAGG